MKHSATKIESIALTLLPDFTPKDEMETQLSFHFTLPPDCSFRVFFEKDSKRKWNFLRYEEITEK